MEGKKIRIRPITMADISSDYLSWLNDEAIRKGLESPPPLPYTKDMLVAYLENMLSDSNTRLFAILDKKGQTHIGNIKLGNIKKDAGVAELGLMIGNKTFHNKGIGNEACRLVMEFGFGTLGLKKIWLAVHSNNLPARKLYENLGFTIEGIQKKQTVSAGIRVDKILMAVFAENSE